MAFDLPAYMDRVGLPEFLPESTPATLPLLAAVMKAQSSAISFENLVSPLRNPLRCV